MSLRVYYRKGPEASIRTCPGGQRLGKSSSGDGAARSRDNGQGWERVAGKLLGRMAQLSVPYNLGSELWRDANTEMQ